MEEFDKSFDIFDATKLGVGDGLSLHIAINKETERMHDRAKDEQSLQDLLQSEREFYKSRLDVIIKNHSIPHLRMDAHIAAFALQGDANELKHTYIRRVNDQLKVMRERRKPLLEKYTNGGKKYTSKQVDELIEGDMSEILFSVKTLEDHIDYLDKLSAQLVNITFSMKYFKDMDDYTRR